jgi:hypothetical protein
VTNASSNFAKDDTSDFTITTPDRTFHVHRIILRQNVYFAALFKHKFRETEEGVFAAPGDEPLLMELTIRLIYGAVPNEILSILYQSISTDASTSNMNIATSSIDVSSERLMHGMSKSLTTYDVYRDAIRLRSKRDPTPEESKISCALLYRGIQLLAILYKYQVPNIELMFMSELNQISKDAWLHQNILTVVEFAHHTLPALSHKMRPKDNIYKSLIWDCSLGLDMLYNEPLFHELLDRGPELAKAILFIKADSYSDNASYSAAKMYCCSAGCRRNQPTVMAHNDWNQTSIATQHCAVCRIEVTLSKRRKWRWTHMHEGEEDDTVEYIGDEPDAAWGMVW